jgi:integrase/recombinase XerD
VRDQIEEFLAYLTQERRLSANTITAYRNDLGQLLAYLESPRAAALAGGDDPAARRSQVLDFVLQLRERGYAPATIARKIAATRSLFHFLSQRGDLGDNPAAELGSPTVHKALPRALSVRDVALLIGRAARKGGPDGLRDRAMLHLLYATGMRVTELVSLNMQDVNLETNQVRCVGRGGRERTVPLEPDARPAVVDYLEHGRPVLARAGSGEAALFLNQRGDRLTRQGFWLIMKALARECGLESQVTPHTLRHSFAAHRLRDGVSLERLRELLGHANISTTQIYTQVRVGSAHPEEPRQAERAGDLAPISQ